MPWPTLRDAIRLPFVRRRPLAAIVEARVRALLAELAFEPNAEPLWETVRRRIADEILFPLWREGRLHGSKPDEAFFVRCDRTTTTQADVDAGRLVVLVGFAPVRPAEFELVRVTAAVAP